MKQPEVVPLPEKGSIYGALAAVVVLWGVNWPIMKVGLDYISPLWFAAARVGLGLLSLALLLAWQRRLRLPPRADLAMIAVVGVLQIYLTLVLIHSGLQFVEAGRSAILAYTTPLWVTPMALLFLGERPSALKWAGIVLGVAGLAVLFSPAAFDAGKPGNIAGNAMLLGAAMVYATAILLIRGRGFSRPVIELIPWQLALAFALLLPTAYLLEGAPSPVWSPELVAVLAYNGPVASAFCFWALVQVSSALPATTTSLGLLGIPVVGFVASALALSEPLSTAKLAGIALILGGLAAVTAADLRQRRKARP